ncbi:protein NONRESPONDING TO OXYLIPINS 2, mitochondrial-like [Gastrolobium bilobum]|uniref:protein NONRESPONDING TO OXYLIPINS 2, mitochondrial-like n=1 Tax=Gastrolobium bilobum TaxID=150636 RepID=UPI002AB1EC4F|nr:protein NONRESPONDING TO OXYLIPINS 2, mitochondrial-like [Gastrolobium bilobum]
MATSTLTSKVLSRLSCRLQILSQTKLAKPSSLSLSAPRLSRTSRLPVELGSIGSMLPLHSAVASARLVSSLCIESLGWCLVPQGISMPL